MTFLRCATRWHRAHLVCAVSPHSHAIIFFHSLSLTHIYFTCYTPCASFYGQRDVVAVPFPLHLLHRSFYIHLALLVSLFLTPCGSISHLYFLGLLTQLKKPNIEKKWSREERINKYFALHLASHFISLISFRCVAFCLLFALFNNFYGRTKNAQNVSVTFMMWQCYLTNTPDTCTVVILYFALLCPPCTSHKSLLLVDFSAEYPLFMSVVHDPHKLFALWLLLCGSFSLFVRIFVENLCLSSSFWNMIGFNLIDGLIDALHSIRVGCVSFQVCVCVPVWASICRWFIAVS